MDTEKKYKIVVDDGDATKKVTGFGDNLKKLKESFSASNLAANGLGGTLKNVGSALGGLTKAAWSFVATPLGAIITGLVLGLTALYKIFKDFGPLLDKIEQSVAAVTAAFSKLKDSFKQFISGNKSFAESFKGIGKAMNDAAKEAANLKKAQQDLGDQMVVQKTINDQTAAEIERLTILSKNKSLTDQQRIDLNNEITRIEKENYEQNKKLAEEEIRIAQENIILKKTLNDEEKAMIRDLDMVKISSLKATGQITEEEAQILANQLSKRIDLERQHTNLIEKTNNRRDALDQQRQAAEDKRRAEAEAKREKTVEADLKRDLNMINIFKLQQEEYDKDKLVQQGVVNEEYKNNQLKYYDDLYNQTLEFAKKQFDLGKITAEELQIAELEANKAKLDSIKKLNNDILASQEKAEAERKKLEEKAAEERKKEEELELENKKNNLIKLTEDYRINYELRLQYLNEYLELANKSEEEAILARKKLHDDEQQAKMQKAKETVQYIADLDQNLTEFKTNLLTNQLKNGQITQEEFDKKSAEIERKSAIRKKAYGIAETIINTATAIMKTGANLGYPTAIPFQIAAGILGATQIATIASAPIDGTGTGSAPSGSMNVSSSEGTAPTTSFTFADAPKTNEQPVLKTYVIAKDVSTQQQLDRQTIENGTI
jgi:colicin import membrane protein